MDIGFIIALHVIVCSSIFFLVYTLFLFFSERKFNLIKSNLYIIIPLYCILCWALFYAIFINCFFYTLFKIFNEIQPIGVKYGYKYLPNFAVIIGIPLYLLPSIYIAYKVFYVINIILAMIYVILFNKILILLKLKKKIHRFLFLFAMSNGFIVLEQFKNNQMKFLIGAILLFILKQEIQFRIKPFDKDLKFYLINYNLFILIVGAFPYLLFYFLIYLFQDIPKNELFKKKNLKKYTIIIISFTAQNFLFLLYPSLIREYYNFIQVENTRFNDRFSQHYLRFYQDYNISIPKDTALLINNILYIILYIIVGLLVISRSLTLEQKFGLLSISIYFISYVAYRISLVLLPLTILLFVPFINQEFNGIEFIKRNKPFIIGYICILGINFINYGKKPYYPFLIGYKVVHFFLVIILGVSILLLYNKINLSKENNLVNIE